MKRDALPRVWTGYTPASAAVCALLCLYFAGWLAVCLAHRLDWRSLAFTGGGAAFFALQALIQIRGLHLERRAAKAQSEYSFTASRHRSKPARSP